jgi:hypothetical protein
MNLRTIGFTILTILIVTSVSYACHINFDPESYDGNIGEEINVTATVKWEHGRCVLDEYDFSFEKENLTLVKESGWEKVSRGKYKNEYTFRLVSEGDAMARVYRECSRKGVSEEIMEIKVKRTYEGTIKNVKANLSDLSAAIDGEKNVDPIVEWLTMDIDWLSAQEEKPDALIESTNKIIDAVTEENWESANALINSALENWE